jgi:hypothetical protein
MNLIESILLSELKKPPVFYRIKAGGPGSGCHGSNCGRPPLKEGDIVKIQKPISVWNQKTGNNDKYPIGTKATVINVLPKIGTAVQQISVQVKKYHDPTYFGANDVKLHKAAGPTTVETDPVPKSKIKQQFTSNDGAQVTIVKTPEQKEYDPKTIKDLANQSSRYKGQFEQIDKVNGLGGNITRMYDSSKVPSTAWGKDGPATAASRPGATVWVHRYSDHVTIEEQSYQKWGLRTRGMVQWKYNNIGQAFGMLKKRYGISIPLSKERF